LNYVANFGFEIEQEHEDFSNTAQSGASLTFPMQVFFHSFQAFNPVNIVLCLEKGWLCLHQG
jgi:hypothetical protein